MNPAMIVVADSSCARIFTADSPKAPLKEIEVLAHPQSRLHEREITSDLPGKSNGRGGSGGHAYQNQVDTKKTEQKVFCKEVAGYLEKARTQNKLDELLIVAAPAFLGELRSQMSNATNNKVIFELNMNLTRHSPEDIRGHLPKVFTH